LGSETDIQRDIISALGAMGFFVWRNHTQGVMVRGSRRVKNKNAGSPDIMALKNGVFYAIEVKTKTGKVSDEQIQWLRDANGQGAVAMVVRSLQDVLDIIEDLGRKKNRVADMVDSMFICV